MSNFVASSCHGCFYEGQPKSHQCMVCDNYSHYQPNTGPSTGYTLKKAHTTKKCSECGTTIKRGTHFYKKVLHTSTANRIRVSQICVGCEMRKYYDSVNYKEES